jgi:hypothetical protein
VWLALVQSADMLVLLLLWLNKWHLAAAVQVRPTTRWVFSDYQPKLSSPASPFTACCSPDTGRGVAVYAYTPGIAIFSRDVQLTKPLCKTAIFKSYLMLRGDVCKRSKAGFRDHAECTRHRVVQGQRGRTDPDQTACQGTSRSAIVKGLYVKT